MSIKAAAPLVLVGAGKMGSAMLKGWLGQGLSAGDVRIIDPGLPEAAAEHWRAQGVAVSASAEDLGKPSLLVLAIKPQMMDAVLNDLAPLVPSTCTIVSVAAGTSLRTLRGAFGPDMAIVRAMPNTPAQVGQGMTVLCPNGRLKETMRGAVQSLMEAIGTVAWIEDEAGMDAVTAVSGSGPAYVFHMVEALAAAAVSAGLEAGLAMQLARQTVIGAARLLEETTEEAAVLRQNVTSPGGTTQAALVELMAEDGLGCLMQRTVAAAAARSRELARE